MVEVVGQKISVQTKTCRAVFENGWLVELTDLAGGPNQLQSVDSTRSPLALVHANQGATDVIGELAATITAHQLSPDCAQYRFNGWDGDGVLTISECAETGDVLVEPAAYSSRRGLLSIRWKLDGLDPSLQVVAPFFQGVKLPIGDVLLNRRWYWPQFWEAGLVIFERPAGGGFWVHCRDDRYRSKALNIDGAQFGLETEAYGPTHSSLGAGGLVWRINVFEGDWRAPAGVYRDWLWQAYGLARQEALRPAWHQDIRFALSWYRGGTALLDALAAQIEPSKVLLHFAEWRTDGYDENYPTFTPSEEGKATIAKANEMGFHILPHANSVDMDPSHPAYAYLRDFEYREVNTLRRIGWGWDPASNRVLGVPNSNHNLVNNRWCKVMVKIHPGLAMWRSILCEEIQKALAAAPNDAIFIDVTLCAHNVDQMLVEDTTVAEGMKRLIEQVQCLNGGIAVGGEGINEITMQGLAFAQAHLFASWHESVEGLDRVGHAALGDFLWGRLCRAFGYSGLGGQDERSRVRLAIHEQLGAIPTVTVNRATDISEPNEAVQRALDQARS